jgi:hypothetical protein
MAFITLAALFLVAGVLHQKLNEIQKELAAIRTRLDRQEL